MCTEILETVLRLAEVEGRRLSIEVNDARSLRVGEFDDRGSGRRQKRSEFSPCGRTPKNDSVVAYDRVFDQVRWIWQAKMTKAF
jgi:hypothetical protein